MRLPPFLTVSVLLVTALLLGYLGWILPRPGGSFVVPTLIVFGSGCAATIGYWILTGGRAVAVALLTITVIASVWTLEFSMPASLAWDSGANAQAVSALEHVRSSPRGKYGVPLHPCSRYATGGVGRIDAPYGECAVSTAEGNIETFTASDGSQGGLGYTDIGAAAFEDECARHLVGSWWTFTPQPDGTGGCPIGYRYSGGG